MKKILLVGGSGGLGSQLFDKLKNHYEVISVSSKELDIRNFLQCEDFFSKTSFDIILNLAGLNYDTLIHKIDNNNINPSEISLIKVDIKGGEEFILNDLYYIHKKYSIPLYISFHYDWWKDKNLNRFDFLTESYKKSILNNPFISILFNF